jgi:hypothetical protein
MDDDKREYLQSIGMTPTAIERAQVLCDRFVRAFSIPINDIVVADAFDQTGNRHYLSLWIASDRVISECKNFMTSDNVDFVSLKSGVMWLMVSYKDYDFETNTANCSVMVDFRMSIQFGGQITGVYNNCQPVVDFTKKYLLTQF